VREVPQDAPPPAAPWVEMTLQQFEAVKSAREEEVSAILAANQPPPPPPEEVGRGQFFVGLRRLGMSKADIAAAIEANMPAGDEREDLLTLLAEATVFKRSMLLPLLPLVGMTEAQLDQFMREVSQV
jgi:hypothetical protein